MTNASSAEVQRLGLEAGSQHAAQPTAIHGAQHPRSDRSTLEAVMPIPQGLFHGASRLHTGIGTCFPYFIIYLPVLGAIVSIPNQRIDGVLLP